MFSKSDLIGVRTFVLHFWFPATLPDKKTKKTGELSDHCWLLFTEATQMSHAESSQSGQQSTEKQNKQKNNW